MSRITEVVGGPFPRRRAGFVPRVISQPNVARVRVRASPLAASATLPAADGSNEARNMHPGSKLIQAMTNMKRREGVGSGLRFPQITRTRVSEKEWCKSSWCSCIYDTCE
jgi:hypothetical protein